MNTERLKDCKLFKGEWDVEPFHDDNLQYAFYAEAFYCTPEKEQADEAARDVAFYKVDMSAYKDIPTPLLNQLFSVWMNKLAGTSNPDVVVSGFHNKFMRAYMKVES